MFGKGSRLYSIFAMKCPRCHEGDVFETHNPYQKMTAIKETCPHCGLRYEKEMGFFYGAMYVSYMLNIALFVTSVVAYFILLDQYISGTLLMVIYVSLTVILMPVYYRLSRTIWLNFFNSYAPEKRGTK
ncbi:hypothetical protein GCM10011514_25110 [Emticicia aquatilis]|uniref:DUF983 domain-containing protein n=2 Tax=Emticicia aquatilis TaxID=1537369 RepID=A0A916YTJ1_9BACT|nr:hypothetical protein GCM10011514_25110 [Emticicia aquatilis]